MANPGGAGAVPSGISLSNSVHSEVAPCLPLPSLPVLCGAVDQELRLFDDSRSLNHLAVVHQASKIAQLLQHTDVAYLKLRTDVECQPYSLVGHIDLYDEVLRYNADAFDSTPPVIQIQRGNLADSKPSEQPSSVTEQKYRDFSGTHNIQQDHIIVDDVINHSRKPKVRTRKETTLPTTAPDDIDPQDGAVQGFSEMLEELCGKAEILSDVRDEADWLPLTVTDLRKLVNEIVSIRTKKMLHFVSVDILSRLLRVLDHQIHRAEGLSVNDCEHGSLSMLHSIS